MFDIGFGELLVIAIVGLLILGPERLPVAIKTVSLWVGRFKRSYRQIRTEIEKEIGADDIRRQLHNEEIMQSLNATKQQFNQMADETREGINQIKEDASVFKADPKAVGHNNTIGDNASEKPAAAPVAEAHVEPSPVIAPPTSQEPANKSSDAP